MTAYQTAVLRAISAILSSPRDRYGRLVPSQEDRDALRKWALAARGKARIPHGGRDILDQCSMLLQGLLGDPIRSVIDQEVVRSNHALVLTYSNNAGRYAVHAEGCRAIARAGDIFPERFATVKEAGQFAQANEAAKGGDALLKICKCAKHS